MFARAVIAFLVLPGTVAFIVPAAWLWYSGHTHLAVPFGLMILAIGLAGLMWCVRDFYVSGKGTLAPWAPPEKLVVVGLYRYSRNPMYISVELVLLGWAISFGSLFLYLYTLIVLTAFHIRVVWGEEPWLARKYSNDWKRYSSQVPRWLW